MRIPEGNRTVFVALTSLFVGAGLAAYGIHHGSDLVGLGIVIGAVTAPVLGAHVVKTAVANNADARVRIASGQGSESPTPTSPPNPE